MGFMLKGMILGFGQITRWHGEGLCPFYDKQAGPGPMPEKAVREG